MDATTRSTAGVRQFEQTAVAKLVAEGVPKHVADAFVHHGIPKTGRVQQIKDQVCKMTYERFFIPVSDKDFDNPARVGALFPHITESKTQKFHTEFQMSDLDAAKFTKAFPEFDVVARGKTYNQHAFYANKRYAETELLVAMVFRDAIDCDLNPRSLIDFGGNQPWHVKRNRDYVHCDNPVLSSRDIMRYKVREIFSSADESSICRKRFSECDVQADYAIAVHSTYDVSPKQIARAMLKKKVKKFYGVINYIPGVETKQEGTFEADGIVMAIVRPARGPAYAKCSFRHDPSLEYTHRLSVLRKYLYVRRRYDFANADGTLDSFTYSIQSVRGNALIFQIVEGGSHFNISDALWTPPTKKLYYLSLRLMGVDRMEVDAEFFDRLVLYAASTRNHLQFDIVALFRYAKSLRQRVSINNVVLSSGYTQNPQELINSVIAAYATASAYCTESREFFKRASSQVSSFRNKGFIIDAFEIAAAAFKSLLLAIPAALVEVTGLSTLNQRITQLVATGGSVTVQLYKPHAAQGAVFNPAAFRRVKLVSGLKPVLDAGSALEASVRSYNDVIRSTYVECDSYPTCFYSKALLAYDPHELPRATSNPVMYEFDSVEFAKSKPCVDIRDKLYALAMQRVGGFSKFDSQAVVMRNGDRLYRSGLTQADGVREVGRDDVPLVSDQMQYIVFRGVGDRAVALTRPAMYSKGVCVRFVLFYYRRSTYSTHTSRQTDLGLSSTTVNDLPDSAVPFEDKIDDHEPWSSLSDQDSFIKRFSSPEQGAQFVKERLANDEFYMSGALPNSNPITPAASDGPIDGTDYVGDYTSPFVADQPDDGLSTFADHVRPSLSSGPFDGLLQRDGDTVQSEEVVKGRNAMLELIELSERSEQVAVASSRAIIDLAVAAASGDAPISRFRSTAQGHPGDIKLIKAEGGEFFDMVNKEVVSHMAVSDGVEVYDKLTKFPPDGVYVTSNELFVYTGGAIKSSVQRVSDDPYSCQVHCINGVAGSGKSYHIEHNAQVGDVVLCETRESLEDVARGLQKLPGWRGHAYTVDAFLMHRPVTEASTLWIDEAFRLHAGKIYAVMKILKPNIIYCFGDDKQIPVLPFVPKFEFQYHEFPFTKYILKKDSYRCPADVCFALSQKEYYAFQVQTHNPIMRSILEPKQFVSGMFDVKPRSVPLLVYTQTCKDDLRKQGVSHVLTIGEAQGKTYDHVILFRDNTLPKAIYFSPFQSLVAITRHRKSFQYVTVDSLLGDNSGVASLYKYIKARGSELLYASHYVSGVRPAADANALEARSERPVTQLYRGTSVTSVTEQSMLDPDSWADVMDDIEDSLSYL